MTWLSLVGARQARSWRAGWRKIRRPPCCSSKRGMITPIRPHLPDEIKYGNTSYAESPASEHNWALRGTITDEQGEIHVAQGKVIGGGSSINGQAMQRGLPEDFDSWAAMGNEQWSYAKVLPFFRKCERDLDIHDDFSRHRWPDAGQAPPRASCGRHPTGLPRRLCASGLPNQSRIPTARTRQASVSGPRTTWMGGG